MAKLDKFGYGTSNNDLGCGIKKNITNKYHYYDNNSNKWQSGNNGFNIATWNLWGAAHFDNISLIKDRIKYII
jgi:hypothetical protein